MNNSQNQNKDKLEKNFFKSDIFKKFNENKIIIIPIIIVIFILLFLALFINFKSNQPIDKVDYTYVSPMSENFGEIKMYKTSYPGSPESGGEFDEDHISTDYSMGDSMWVVFDFNFPKETKSEARYKIVNLDSQEVVKEGQFDMAESGIRPLRILSPKYQLREGRYIFKILSSASELIGEKSFNIN